MKSIFISSTFKDMQSERDMLQYLIYPRIRNDLRKYGEDLNILDLRWGVDTLNLSEEESGKIVLKVCIDAIDRCVPYIIVFLGERYGWIPEEDIITETNDTRVDKHYSKGMSITNLEIEYGAFSEICSIEKCIFCFRNPAVNENIEEDYRKTYDSESETHRQKLELLKNRIRQNKNATIIEYDAYWDLKNHKIAGLEKLQEQLYQSLKDKILIELQNQLKKHPYEQMKLEMELTKQQHLSTYAKRYKDENEVILEIIEKIIGNEEAKNIHIKASSGVGKTALISELEKTCSKINMKTILCYGGINGCQDYYTLKEYVTYQLEACLEIEHNKTTESLNERLIELDKMIEHKFQVICFLDAIDQILNEHEVRVDLLDLCPNIIFIISSTTEISLTNDNIKCIEIDGLLDEQISGMITNITAQRGKTLNQDIIQKIKKRNNANNPLYLSNLLQRLFMISAKEFETAEDLAPGIEGIHKYMNQILNEIPDDQYAMISYLMREASNFFQSEDFQQIISLIDVSKDGLTENELREILALKEIQFNSLLFSQIVTFLYDVFEQKNNGKWAFKHRLFHTEITDDKEVMRLLCQYALSNDDFMQKEGLYYLVESKHDKGYLIFEKGNIESMQAFMIRLLKNDDTYLEYFVKMAEKAECNICLENVCRLNHETLNQMQEVILDKIFTNENLSKKNKIRYLLKKIDLCIYYDKTYLKYLEQLKVLDEEHYYHQLACYKFRVGLIAEADEIILKAIHLAEQKKKSKESVENLFNYVKTRVQINTKFGDFFAAFDPFELEIYKELFKENSKAEAWIYSELSVLYTQNKYFDAQKVITYRDEAIKKAELMVERLPSIDNLELIIDVYTNARKTVKSEYRYEYLKSSVKYYQRLYELTRQDIDLYHWACELADYAKSLKNEDTAIKIYKQALGYLEILYSKNIEVSNPSKKKFLYTKASYSFLLQKSDVWENRKTGVTLLEEVVNDDSFCKLNDQSKLRYLDVLMEHWIHNYNYTQASLWIETFDELTRGIIADRAQYREHALKYQKALMKDGKTDSEYLSLSRDLFVHNLYSLSLESYERIENKDILNETDQLSILLSQYMNHYMDNYSNIIEIPTVEVSETDYYTKTVSVMYSFVKMRESDDKQSYFLKAIKTLLYDLCENMPEEKIESIVIPKLNCFLNEFNDFENIDISTYGKMVYRIPIWVFTFHDDKKYAKDLLCRFAKLYKASGIDKFAVIAEFFYELTTEESKMPARKQCSIDNIKEYYNSNIEKLKRVVRIYTQK